MFALSEETPFQIQPKAGTVGVPPGAPDWAFFMPSVHTPVARLGLIILANSRVVFEPVTVTGEEKGLLTVGLGLPQISADGLEARLFFRSGTTETLIASVSLPERLGGEPWIEQEFSLKAVAGRTGQFLLECDPGPRADSTADWLAVYECVISPPGEFR